jgi:acetyl esterase/lipase
VPYGAHPDHVANLHLPAGEGPFPAVVLVHGGVWRSGWDRTLMTPLAHDLARRGIAAWNIEYRRVGQPGGGWPGTFSDVAAALDRLVTVEYVDSTRVATCGHSAGGHLALWLAARQRLPSDIVGARPTVRPKAAVALAPVTDLARTHRDELGGGAVAALLGGGPDDVPERYAATDPFALLPLGVPQLLVHGGRDETVPPTHSRRYVAAAADEAELREFPDADHFDVIDPEHDSWAAVAELLPGLIDGSGSG